MFRCILLAKKEHLTVFLPTWMYFSSKKEEFDRFFDRLDRASQRISTRPVTRPVFISGAASIIDFVVFAGVYSGFVYDGAFAAIAIQGAVCRGSKIARLGLKTIVFAVISNDEFIVTINE